MTVTRFLHPWLKIDPVHTTGEAARRYVPLSMANRGFTVVRLAVVTWILGAAGKPVFGQYNFALETINCLVPLVLFGLSDVAERYAAEYERRGELAAFLRRQALRLATLGGALVLLFAALAPLLGRPALIIMVGLNVAVLAFYQWMVGVLRGLRAYGAAAGMETLAAGLFVLLAAIASVFHSSPALLAAYLLANALALAWYAREIRAHVGRSALSSADAPPAASLPAPQLDRFGRWALVRLLLMMTFGFVSMGSIQWLARHAGHGAADADSATGEYGTPYRIAQLLSSAGIALWASSYAIAARAWAHGAKRRAVVRLFRVGKFGGVGLILAATALTIGRDVIAFCLPATYTIAIQTLLPPLLGLFIWYAMLAFLVVYGDLEERPWIGALLWSIAVALQIGMIVLFTFVPALRPVGDDVPWTVSLDATVIWASAVGLGVATLLVAPALLWRPRKMSATAVPIGLVLACGAAFFTPSWVVGTFAGVVVAVAIGFLWMSGLLVRRRRPALAPDTMEPGG